jgi:hypothetical protein
MKKTFSLALMLICIAATNTLLAQTCPTGLQDCYIYGSLSGSNLMSMDKRAIIDFSINPGSFCPAGRVNCNTTYDYVITVTRVTGTGLMSFGGFPNNASTTVQRTFVLSPCDPDQPFSVSVLRQSTTASWEVSLTSVENGRVCNSKTYTIFLSAAL